MSINTTELSIIICTYNSEQTIRKTLEAVFASTVDQFEVVVVDDGSTDSTVDICSRFPVKLIRMKRNSGPSVCRNVGAKGSIGNILLFVDSDAVFAADVIERMLTYLQKEPELAGVGTISAPTPLNPCFFSNYFALQEYLVVTRLLGGKDVARLPYACTRCGCLRRKVFEELGGFDESYRKPSIEDYELSSRMTDKYYVLYEKALQNEHHFPETLSQIFKRYHKNTSMMMGLISKRKSGNLGPFARDLWARALIGASVLVCTSAFFEPIGVGCALLMTMGAAGIQSQLLRELYSYLGWKSMVKGWLLYMLCTLPIATGMISGLVANLWRKSHVKITKRMPAR